MFKPDNLSVTLGRNDVEIIARGILYCGFFSLDPYRFRHRLLNGQMSYRVRQEIFECSYVAALLPFDPVRSEVVLIEQVRITAYDTSETPWLLGTVTGMIEEDESVEDVARRGAIEETGPTVGRTKPVLSFLANSGGTSKCPSAMVGEVNTTTASDIHGLADENEGIRVHVVSREQAYQWVEEEKIDDATSVIVL